MGVSCMAVCLKDIYRIYMQITCIHRYKVLDIGTCIFMEILINYSIIDNITKIFSIYNERGI